MAKVRLGEYTKIRTGRLDANAASENGQYPFFTCSVTPLKIDNFSYDCECVLVAGNGDLNVKYYDGKFDAYQRTYIIESVDKDTLIVPYLYRFLEKHVETLRRQAIGGVIKYIKLGNLTDAELNIPSIEDQMEIVFKLDRVDDMIAQRKEQLAKLDQLIKSRFIEMFGELDLSAQKSDWERLSELGTIYTGTTPSTSDEANWDGDILWITPAEMNEESFFISDTVRKITEKGAKSKSLTQMPIGTVLLSTRAPIGKVGIVAKPMTCNQGFKNFYCPEMLNSIYLYVLLKYNTQYLNSIGTGTTFKEISKSTCGNIRIPVPAMDRQNKFAEFVKLIDKSKFVIQQSIDKLETLKKSLMQQYFG